MKNCQQIPLETSYSSVPNKHVGWNKHVGGKILVNLIANLLDGINMLVGILGNSNKCAGGEIKVVRNKQTIFQKKISIFLVCE